MRIIVDLDGTICKLKKDNESYTDVKPREHAVETLQRLKADGHTIIIHTARHMKTCKGNVSEVRKRIEKLTLEWLNKHNIPYDEIYFGKPYGDVYIDDLAIPFKDWKLIETNIKYYIKNRDPMQK